MSKSSLAPAAALLVVLTAWEIAVRVSWLDGLFFPPPSILFLTLGRMLREGEIGKHLGETLLRTSTGFLIGGVAGIVAGVVMGISTWVRRTIEPFAVALNSTPKLTLLPMVMLLAGAGESARFILLATSSFMVVTLNTLDGVRSVSPHFREMAVNYGASKRMLLWRIHLPASAPNIFTGLRLALGRTLVLSITMEMLGGTGGLGYLVWHSWQIFAIERLYIAVLMAAALGLAIHRGLLMLESRLIPWKRSNVVRATPIPWRRAAAAAVGLDRKAC
jgi:NitT/TauT family transport system permease protein